MTAGRWALLFGPWIACMGWPLPQLLDAMGWTREIAAYTGATLSVVLWLVLGRIFYGEKLW